ncbi:MAG: hypothetical protein ACT4UQ_00275 [Gammaproteobacteria bacterium]
MIGRLAAFLAAASLAAAAPASAHPATEQYIPIGKSPGISNVKTRIGRIRSLAHTQPGMTVETQSGPAYVEFGAETRFYVQHADPARASRRGTYADCRAGLMAEAFLADDGTVPWVKILVP